MKKIYKLFFSYCNAIDRTGNAYILCTGKHNGHTEHGNVCVYVEKPNWAVKSYEAPIELFHYPVNLYIKLRPVLQTDYLQYLL